jgi:hypothetical protein
VRRIFPNRVQSRQGVIVLSYLFISLIVVVSIVGGHAAADAFLSLPSLPLWKLNTGEPAGTARQVKVLRASQVVTIAPPNATINIGARFDASSPLSDKYQLVLSLVDSHGNTVAQTRNNLDNKLLALPTTLWLGPVSITTSLTLPNVADGTYSILVGLDSPWGPIALTPGDGVVQDNRYHYRIGEINLRASAPVPSFLPPATLGPERLRCDLSRRIQRVEHIGLHDQ